MAKRIGLSKKTRFEIFKRDSFKCQYCGRSAPEVVLHVDHIKPVAKGGDNTIFNLITSCADCNGGKGARELSAQDAINKSKKQLEELNEKREQLEMMMEWQQELQAYNQKSIAVLENKFQDCFGDLYHFSSSDRATIRRMIDQYGFDEITISIDIAISNNKLKRAFAPYLYGVLKNRKIDRTDPRLSTINRAYCFAKNKFSHEVGVIESKIGPENLKVFFIQICNNFINNRKRSPEEIIAIITRNPNWKLFIDEICEVKNA